MVFKEKQMRKISKRQLKQAEKKGLPTKGLTFYASLVEVNK